MTQNQYGYPQQGGYPDPNQGYGQPAPQGYAPANPYGQPPAQQYQQGVQTGGYGPNGAYVNAPQTPPPNMYGQGQPGYGQPVQQAPGPDLSGDLESFYAQRSVGGGKGISWKGVPDGYTIQGVVSRAITNGDVFKETYPPNTPQAGQLRTNRDGSPKYAMQVPLKLHLLDQFQARDYPDGEGRLFLRGALRDETTRAMAEVGAPEGPPEAGAFIRVTLTHRKPSNNIAQNMFAVLYRSPGTWESDPNLTAYAPPAQPQPPQYSNQPGYGAPQQAPYQQQAPTQYAAPAQAAPNPQQYAQPAMQPSGAQPGQQAYDPNQYAQPQYGQQAYDPNQGQVAQQQYAPNMAPAQPAPNPANQYNAQYALQGGSTQADPNPQYAQQGQPQAPNTQAPAGAVNPGVQAALPGMPNPNQPPVQNGVQPSGLDPAKQALLNRIAGQQGQPAAPQQ